MKILVTGGSGFIGGHLVEKLIKEGHTVYIFDLSAPSYHLDGFDPYNFTMGSLFMHEEVLEATKNMDVVFHLAALANTSICAKNPSSAVRFNCIGTANLLEACLENNVRLVINASSSLVSDQLYNDYKGLCGFDHLVDLSSEGHIYSTTKLFTEMLCNDFFSMYQLPCINLRFGICYGPRMTTGVLVHTFVTHALNGLPMVVHGNGSQWRYYMHVYDLVDGCIEAMNKGIPGSTYNLIPEWKTTVSDVAKTVQHITGAEIQYTDKREFDFNCKELTPSNEFGWEAKIKLYEGIFDTVKWYKEGWGEY